MKVHSRLAERKGVPNCKMVYSKNRPLDPIISVVDQGDKFWNTFFSKVGEWARKLRKMYSDMEIRVNHSN